LLSTFLDAAVDVRRRQPATNPLDAVSVIAQKPAQLESSVSTDPLAQRST
jgi:hypothetical protein